MPGICICVNRQDQQAIDDLFQYLNQTAAQAGPPDAQAQARIQQHIQQGPPSLLYHMAQTLVGQQAALQQLRAQLADCQQQLQQRGRSAGFARASWGGGGQPGYGVPYRQPAGGGFLAGAGQIALGVGGGILAAEALGSLLSGDGLFGNDRDDFDRGYAEGREDSERQDDGTQYDDQGQYDDNAQYDDGGFDGGGFDDGGGW